MFRFSVIVLSLVWIFFSLNRLLQNLIFFIILFFRLDNIVYRNLLSGPLNDFFNVNEKGAIICYFIERVLEVKCAKEAVDETTQRMRGELLHSLTQM